jgi:Squalene-hopene cyclase C-terminal domain
MSYAFLTWALLALAFSGRASDPAPEPPGVRQAVARALPLIRKGSDGHRDQRSCFACHHQAIPILVQTSARLRGFPVEEETLQKHLRHIDSFLTKNREEYQKGRGQGGQADTAGYALWTLELGGWRSDATTAAVTEYLLLFDKDQDHWRTTSHRPPSEVSAFTTSYFASRALLAFGTEGQKERIKRRLDRLRFWLEKTAAQDTEDRVFRLLAMKQARCDATHIHTAAQELLRSQRPDGGWGQTETLASDAYATGTALFALHQAADLPTSSPVYQRGIRCLLETQEPDGSWHVVSRSRPFQTYFESGFPHGNDQFISLAASGWATTALLLALPPQGKLVYRQPSR